MSDCSVITKAEQVQTETAVVVRLFEYKFCDAIFRNGHGKNQADFRRIKMTKDEYLITEPPLKALTVFAMPMILGSFFQQVYNMADSIIVGQFVGSSALAAVGACAALTNVFIYVQHFVNNVYFNRRIENSTVAFNIFICFEYHYGPLDGGRS